MNVNSLTFAKNGRSIAFTEATVLKTTEAAASVASNSYGTLPFLPHCIANNGEWPRVGECGTVMAIECDAYFSILVIQKLGN